MKRADPRIDRRKHSRAPLELPVRLRWPGPFGLRVETLRTLDVSREGLRAARFEPCAAGSRVWVTLPFEAGAPDAQPETPARVVRVERRDAGAVVAIRFDPAPSKTAFRERERRASPRFRMGLPVRIRPGDAPWPEEAMTANVSATGLLVETARQYAMRDAVLAALPFPLWRDEVEQPALVVRVERVPGGIEQRVALARLSGTQR